MLAPRRGCLGYSKVYGDGSWHGIKTDIWRITYSKFSILIPKSVWSSLHSPPLRLMTLT